MQADIEMEQAALDDVMGGPASPLTPLSPHEQEPIGVLPGAHGAGWEEQEEPNADVEFDDENEEEDMHDDDDGIESDEDETAAASRVFEAMPLEHERGCQHYRRGCKLVGPCCGEAFWCRFCHDAAKEQGPSATGPPHKLDRHAVREVECGVCSLRQPVSQTCINTECGTCFGNYFCRICNFFDDDLSKEPFHCDGCGICRLLPLPGALACSPVLSKGQRVRG